ncbi:MAG: type I methionyl aminopeptidase [Actinobacteria bacterium]|nr:type I methionyl aminopeptidase [Actinomycetota bacterium]
MAFRRSIYKSRAQLELMREPGLITAAALAAVRDAVRPGITTGELDAIADRVVADRGAESNFKLVRGYRHTTCISVNDQVVHGIPGSRVLQAGDIVSIDAGAQFKGWNGDSAITVVVPGSDDAGLTSARQALSDVTEGSMWAGAAAMATAKHLGDISAAIEDHILGAGPSALGVPYGILRDYVGHGIGRKMHEAPSLFNYRTPDRGAEVRPGLVLAIEPMVTAGSDQTFVEDDDWTVTTTDGSDGAHWEHSVALHDGGIWVLTAPDGGAAGLAPFGVTPVPLG